MPRVDARLEHCEDGRLLLCKDRRDIAIGEPLFKTVPIPDCIAEVGVGCGCRQDRVRVEVPTVVPSADGMGRARGGPSVVSRLCSSCVTNDAQSTELNGSACLAARSRHSWKMPWMPNIKSPTMACSVVYLLKTGRKSIPVRAGSAAMTRVQRFFAMRSASGTHTNSSAPRNGGTYRSTVRAGGQVAAETTMEPCRRNHHGARH